MSEISTKKPVAFTAVELHGFAGLMALGIQQAGGKIIATCEEGNFGARTHRLNFPDTPIYDKHEDWPIEDLQESGVDIAFGQPACAALSYCNVQTRGLQNPKMMGLVHCHEAALKIRPRAYIVESVINLFKEADPLVSRWEEEWQSYGYQTTRLLENAMHIGVPQRRKRALFIAAKANLDFTYEDPANLPHHTVEEAIGDLSDLPYSVDHQPYDGTPRNELQKYYRHGSKTVSWHMPQSLPECIMRLLPYYHPGLSTNNISEAVMDRWYRPYRKIIVKPLGRPSTMLRRAVWNEESPTLCGGPRIFHPETHRLFTVREHARLMGLPDTWQFDGHNVADAYAQCGKAVSPMVSRWVAERVMACLNDPDGRPHQSAVNLIDAHKAPGHSRGKKGREMIGLGETM